MLFTVHFDDISLAGSLYCLFLSFFSFYSFVTEWQIECNNYICCLSSFEMKLHFAYNGNKTHHQLIVQLAFCPEWMVLNDKNVNCVESPNQHCCKTYAVINCSIMHKFDIFSKAFSWNTDTFAHKLQRSVALFTANLKSENWSRFSWKMSIKFWAYRFNGARLSPKL